MLGWIFGGIGKAAEKVGDAVQKNYRTMRGDVAEKEQHINAEQLAVIAQHTAEFAGRAPKTKWDSAVDGISRLPRPILTFGIIWLFIWAWINPGGFIDYMAAIQIIPDTLWQLFIMIVAFWFGSRLLSEDLRKPKLTEEQRLQALEIIKKRADALAKDKPPDIIIAVPPSKTEPCPPDKLPDVPKNQQGFAAIDAMVADMIRREGGYVNDPADSGGPTNFGITESTLTKWRDKECNANDVRTLTKAEAADIYRALYYIGPRIDALPVELQSHVFDIAVNAGPRGAAKLLQRALNSLGCALIEDGVIGPATVSATGTKPPPDINRALVAVRLEFYDSVVARNPKNIKFINGWRARANLFLEAA